MRDIHFNNLDLNLLRIFDVLLEERSVTRAGARLGMSQSAVSHALNRLRHTLGDELFVRTSAGMRPTARAIEMGPGVRTALGSLQTALTPPEFDPASSGRRFTVVAGPYTCAVLLPPLAVRLRATAPHVQIRVMPGAGLEENLDAGEADVAVIAKAAYPKRFAYDRLFDDRVAWVVRHDHPSAQAPISLEALCAIPHVQVAATRKPTDAAEPSNAGASVQARLGDDLVIENQLASLGLHRTIAVTVPDTFSALAIVSRSDMTTLAPWRLVEALVETGRIDLLRTPYSPPSGEIGLLYRRDRLTDPALAWFVTLLGETARTLEAVEQPAA